MLNRNRVLGAAFVVALVLTLTGSALAWSSAQKIDEMNGNSVEMNTPALDGCPIESPDSLSLYLASKSGSRLGPARARRGAPRRIWASP